MAKSTYQYILQVEVAFLMNYKINPFELFNYVSVSDLSTYVGYVEQEMEKRRKERGNGKDLGKALMSIRDILNYMYS